MEAAGFKLSPSIFTVGATPKTILDLAFCIDIQTEDTGKYRNGGDEMARVSHTLTIRFAKKLLPLDQFKSQLEAMDSEEVIMAKLMERANFPDCRILYKNTKRVVTSSREYLVVEMIFDCEHDWSWQAL
jgi:hypothetical protein